MEELTRLRTERGWSQQRLADESGVNKATINQIEKGRRSPNLDTLEKLADALDIGMSDFFPKAQAPLPFEDARRRGEEQALGQLAAAGPFYTAYEAQGRILASRWQEELREWEEKIPPGERPDRFEAGRLIQWVLDIGSQSKAYEAAIQDTNLARRPELAETLELLEDGERAALSMLKRAVEPIKNDAEFLKIWEASGMESAVSEAENS